MTAMGKSVAQIGVRSQFLQTLLPGPVFDRLHQGPAHTLSSMAFLDPDALQKGHRLLLTAIREFPDKGLRKTNRRSTVHGDPGAKTASLKQLRQFGNEIFQSRLRPKLRSHGRPNLAVL